MAENMFKCPNCGQLCSDEDRYCINCGEDFSNPLGILKGMLDLVCEYAYILDRDPYDKELKPLFDDWKSRNFDMFPLLIADLFDWMGYLGLADGYLDDNEVGFINFILEENYSKSDILDLINNRLDEDYANNLPVSFMLFYEDDLYGKIVNNEEGRMVENLFLVYESIGKLLIAIDENISPSEVDTLNQYMSNLRIQLDGFKSGGYDYLVDLSKNEKFVNGQININQESQLNTQEISNDEAVQNNHDDATLDEYIEELNKLIGLDTVKNDVNTLINIIQVRQVRQQRGMKQPPMSLHLVFSGNPGTGKTTVARLLAKIYHKMGLLSKGHLIETDRSGLVGGYVGQTAIKTQEVIQKAMGGVLFIDEAYTLSSSKGEADYGQESIDTILKAMEDNRDDLIVIVAGYPNLMQEFLQSNPGLESRFNKFIYFNDYTADELYEIFKVMCDENNLILEDRADEFVKTHFVEMYNNRGENFANGRDVRNLFENVLSNQANRLASNLNVSDTELNTLTYEDFK